MNPDKSEMLLRKATAGEKDAIAAIYSSVIGQEGCTWNEYYPGETELREGLETGNLYVLASLTGLAAGRYRATRRARSRGWQYTVNIRGAVIPDL